MMMHGLANFKLENKSVKQILFLRDLRF